MNTCKKVNRLLFLFLMIFCCGQLHAQLNGGNATLYKNEEIKQYEKDPIPIYSHYNYLNF